MLLKLVVPFYWQPIVLTFSQGTASSVSLAAFLSNPESQSISYSVSGLLPDGVTLAGDTVSYDGEGAVGSILVRFVASAGPLAIESDPTTVAVVAPMQSPPAWRSTTPNDLGSFTRTGGGTYALGDYGTDPDNDTLSYTRAGTAQDTAPGTVTVGRTTGLVTIPAGLAVGSYSLVVRLSDGHGGTADHTFTFRVSATAQATFTVSLINGVITTKRVSTGATVQTGVPINGTTIGAAPGDIIEIKSGSYSAFGLKSLRGTASNRITVRVQPDGIVYLTSTATGFRFVGSDCQYLTLDGATTNPAANLPIVHLPSPYRCGLVMNGTGKCTAWVKWMHEKTGYLTKGITVQYLEIAGSNNAGICMDTNDHTSDAIYFFPNQWREDFTLRYCYFHDAGGCYLGTNYLCNEYEWGLEVPHRRTTVEYCRIVNTDQECCTLKKHWQGPNYVRYNWFERSGRRTTNDPPQRGIGGLQNSTAIVHDNFILYSARGQSGYAQAGEYGHGAHAYYGPGKTGIVSAGNYTVNGVTKPVPKSSYDQYPSSIPHWEVEYYNNVIVDAAEAGIQVSQLSISDSPDRNGGVTSLPAMLYKIYNNTVINCGRGVKAGGGIAGSSGISCDSAAGATASGSFVRNNISLENAGGGLGGSAATLGANLNKVTYVGGETLATLFESPSDTAYKDRSYRLLKAVAVAAGSTLGTNVARTDIAGAARTLSSADMGAYERT